MRNKTILIVSPQQWGIMMLSKQHYAKELAARNNKVFFLNPPSGKNGVKSISISLIDENLWLIDHNLDFPYVLKFHVKGLFHFFMKRHVGRILRKIEVAVDVVWSFDLGDLYPFKFFPSACTKIFHPVDDPITSDGIDSACGAHIILSVTQEILAKYNHIQVPKLFLNHGIAEDFLSQPLRLRHASKVIRVGFSGNLLRRDIDWDTLLSIIQAHPDKEFRFFGSYTNSNVGEHGLTEERRIQTLRIQKNVKLFGALPIRQLVNEYSEIDVWLICYDIQKDQSKGTNYHKIMEFLSTGKVIISNNVTTYAGRGDLVIMSAGRYDNGELPGIFSLIVNNLEVHNKRELQLKRRGFAAENTYAKQIDRLSFFMEKENIIDSCVVLQD